jgi:hypothetical protein
MKFARENSTRLPTRRRGFSEASRISKEIITAALSRVAATLSKFITQSLLIVALTGCQSDNYNHYTAPEITGRVLAAGTHQPLTNVHVLRGGPKGNFEPFGPPNGGKLLIQPAPVFTDADGRFLLESKSVFALFRSAGWWSAPVTYQRAGYESFSTNYTAANVVSNTSVGPPVVDAGDVLLKPEAK